MLALSSFMRMPDEVLDTLIVIDAHNGQDRDMDQFVKTLDDVIKRATQQL